MYCRTGYGRKQPRGRTAAIATDAVQVEIEITHEQGEDKVLTSYGILPMNASAFREWNRLMHRRSDTMPEDTMIAATADVYRRTTVVRNVSDFGQRGVEVRNPCEPYEEGIYDGITQTRR